MFALVRLQHLWPENPEVAWSCHKVVRSNPIQIQNDVIRIDSGFQDSNHIWKPWWIMVTYPKDPQRTIHCVIVRHSRVMTSWHEPNLHQLLGGCFDSLSHWVRVPYFPCFCHAFLAAFEDIIAAMRSIASIHIAGRIPWRLVLRSEGCPGSLSWVWSFSKACWEGATSTWIAVGHWVLIWSWLISERWIKRIQQDYRTVIFQTLTITYQNIPKLYYPALVVPYSWWFGNMFGYWQPDSNAAAASICQTACHSMHQLPGTQRR